MRELISTLNLVHLIRPSRSFALLLGTSALFVLMAAVAGPRDYLFRNERVCDADRVFCIRGTLSYQVNPHLMRLRARVKKAPGPGLLRIRLTGTNRQGHRRYAPFEVRVRGRATEIINHKMIPDYPDAQSWVVQQVEFIADESR